jgi:PAS domain S-box-containing protein
MKLFIFIILFATYSLFAKEVLLLHSYHKGYAWSDDISKTIEKELFPYQDIEVSTEYMDTKRITTSSYINKLALLYKEKFSKRNFDLIIVSDNNAFDFAVKHKDTLFKNIPILFCGINNFDKKNFYDNNLQENMTGILEGVDLEKNFELITKLHPNANKLLILNDTSKTGLALKKDLEPIIQNYKSKLKIEYIDNMNIKAIKTKVSKLDKNTIILFLLFSKDKEGQYFTYKKGFKKIKASAQVPIYGVWDFYIKYGLVGGLLTSAVSQGESVSKMAIDILTKNKPIHNIPIITKSPNKYIFNYNEVEKYNIKIEPFIKNYSFINKPKSIYEEYTEFVLLSIISIFILSGLVLIMRVNIQQRKVLQKDLQNRIKFDKVLLNTIPNAIYYKNQAGEILGCNQAFTLLFNINQKDILGKTAHDIYPQEIARENENIDKKLFKNLGRDHSELTLHFDNSSMKHIILNKAVYLNADKTIGGIVCIMDDITERMQQKQFLIQQGKLAEMGDMIAAVAHQWNEPLVELSAQVQDIQTSYLLDELEKLDINTFVNDSMVQIKYMSKTLSDFRSFLKPSTKKVLFSIKQSFDEIFEIIGKQIFYSNIDVEIEYKDNKNTLNIYGYENEFKQVLLNIINNAKNKIVEIEDNENTRFKIDITIESDKNNNIIKIIDNGGNIEESIITNIFDPYFTTKKDGTGFGLYMAKVIIEDKMNGTISVTNEKNIVVFTLTIPNNIGENNENTTS